MNRMRSFLMPALGAFALVVGGMTIGLDAQRGGGGVGQGRPSNPGPANPGQGGRPGGSGGGNPNAGGGGGNPNAGGGGGNAGNPNAGGGGRNGGNPNAGGGGDNGNPNKGGGNARGGKPDGAGAGRGRGDAATKPTEGGDTGRGGGRGNAANGQKDAQGFKNYGQFVAAQHVSENLGIDFDKLKALMTSDNPKSLGQAIQELRPDVDANAEAAKAEKQAATSSSNPS
jgi:hypothetical protein